MSGEDERQWGYVEGVSADRLLAAFEGARPLTAAEIADAAGVSEQTARAELARLRDDGLVRRKAVAGVTVWFRPVTAFGADDDAGGRSPGDAVADLDVPGTSDMMRDWRRTAVRAAYDFLADEAPVEEPTFVEEVFPSHSAGYDDPDAWWGMVRPRLRTLPGVDAPTWRSETTWRFERAAVPGEAGEGAESGPTQ
ncbi:transcriptional regulator [Halostella litorea]|uniref:transcriptional regulator n=1 Tax=Halostella litorea TaxID=2528831 RepID=UPI0010922602|nr:helix-turn-helix domain-containing protein [Halostella litorea]